MTSTDLKVWFKGNDQKAFSLSRSPFGNRSLDATRRELNTLKTERERTKRRVEELDFESLWVTEFTGRDPYTTAAHLLAHTQSLTIATGIANVWEVCHHLRGEAGPRQIEGAKVGLAHVIGLASACGIHILESNSA